MFEGSIDKFGRVLIPKGLREDLHLQPGDTFLIKKADHTIILKFKKDEPPLRHKGKVLVFCGQAAGDIDSVVSAQREARHHHILKGYK